MLRILALVWLLVSLVGGSVRAQTQGEMLPTGMRVTPSAAPGSIFQPLNPHLAGLPDFLADSAVAMALSPDGNALLILTSGYNLTYGADGKKQDEGSKEYVFVFDVSAGAPVQRQVIALANSFIGLGWAPDGRGFYVSGGVDDSVLRYRWQKGGFVADWQGKLGHKEGNGPKIKPVASGLAASPDGKSVLIANYENDSVTLLDAATGAVTAERDLRPGRINPLQSGTPGGSYPWTVAWSSPSRAFVSIQRDREVLALDIRGNAITVARRLRLAGSPNQMLVSRDGSRLYIAQDNSDTVAAIETQNFRVLADIKVAAPAEILPNPAGLRGANPNFLALSTDERVLFVSLGGLNAISVVRLDSDVLAPSAKPADDDDDDDDDANAKPTGTSRSIGLIPTGWYPNAVSVSRDGRFLYVANGKAPPGPNPAGCQPSTTGDDRPCRSSNQMVLQLEKAGFLAMKLPSPASLAALTRQVARNDNFPPAGPQVDHAVMQELHQRIRHVIYVIKENRTYDQVFGDLERGNGDPHLAMFPEALSPNHHALARAFVTLDNFTDAGAVSATGWNWSTAARTSDMTEKTVPVFSGQHGLTYDWEGQNRMINVALPTAAERHDADPRVPDDPDLLAGTADVAAPDAAVGGEGRGYIWDQALRTGLSVRNYGFFGDLSSYSKDSPKRIPPEHDPAAKGLVVFSTTKQALMGRTDPYYRGFDMEFADFWRIREWQREFREADAAGTLPTLTLLRLPHDHFGNFKEARDGVNTVETQFADNDYALGLLVETVAASREAGSTLIFVTEDDAQSGPDHVDAHRAPAFVIGPYVKRQAVVSTRYTTVSMLRTIEEVLGLPPMGLNDGLTAPMDEVFDLSQPNWTYRAIVPEILRTTDLPVPARAAALDGPALCQRDRLHDAHYWDWASRGQNFEVEDHLDVDAFNRALWSGRMGRETDYPGRSGQDLREGRDALLATWRREMGCSDQSANSGGNGPLAVK